MPEPSSDQAKPMTMRVSQGPVDGSIHKAIKRMAEKLYEDSSPGVLIAVRYATAFIISPENKPLKLLKKEDMAEVADYDPARNALLFKGAQEPSKLTPLFWFIFRAKPETNVILVVPKEATFQGGEPPVLQTDTKYLNTETCLAALPELKEKNAVKLTTSELVFMLEDLKEAETILKSVKPGE